MLDFADFNILRIQLMCANDAALWYRQELSVALKRFFLNGRLDISLLDMGAKFASYSIPFLLCLLKFIKSIKYACKYFPVPLRQPTNSVAKAIPF